MQTIAFQTDKQTDFELLVSLTNRIGIKQLSNVNYELLNFLNDQAIKKEIALILFKHKKFALGKASEFAGLHQIEFQKLLKEREIPIHYDIEDLNDDIENLKSI